VGSTVLAVVPPVFCTVRDAVKEAPVVVDDGMVNAVMPSAAGYCTVTRLLFVEGEDTAAPLLASVPLTCVENRSVPVAVPFSV